MPTPTELRTESGEPVSDQSEAPVGPLAENIREWLTSQNLPKEVADNIAVHLEAELAWMCAKLGIPGSLLQDYARIVLDSAAMEASRLNHPFLTRPNPKEEIVRMHRTIQNAMKETEAGQAQLQQYPPADGWLVWTPHAITDVLTINPVFLTPCRNPELEKERAVVVGILNRAIEQHKNR